MAADLSVGHRDIDMVAHPQEVDTGHLWLVGKVPPQLAGTVPQQLGGKVPQQLVGKVILLQVGKADSEADLTRCFY